MVNKFDQSRINCVGVYVDGTLYRKDVEYIPDHGSIQDSHDFFRFSAYERLKQGQSPEQISQELVALYKAAIQEGTLKTFIDSVPDGLKSELGELIPRHRSSNARVMMDLFGTSSTFLHEMLSSIDFDFILAADPKLRQLIERLKDSGYKLGILTTEVYDTVQKVLRILGLDITDFHINTGHQIPILTTENVKEKKPSAEGFERLVKGFGASSPNNVVYVGDHIVKDIEGSIRCGLQSIHVLNRDDGEDFDFDNMDIEGDSVEYARARTIYDVEKVLRT